MANSQASLILHTKLHRPEVGNDYVSRPRLLERLTRNPNCALTLVVATGQLWQDHADLCLAGESRTPLCLVVA